MCSVRIRKKFKLKKLTEIKLLELSPRKMNIIILIYAVPSDIISTRYILILSYHLHPGLSNGFFHVFKPSPHIFQILPKNLLKLLP